MTEAKFKVGDRVQVRFRVNDECHPPYVVEGAAVVRQVNPLSICCYAITLEADGSHWVVDDRDVVRVLDALGKDGAR